MKKKKKRTSLLLFVPLGLCDPGFPQHRWKRPGCYNQSKLEITGEDSEETLQDPADRVKSIPLHFDNCMWAALGWRGGSWVISIHSARSSTLSPSCVHVFFLSLVEAKGSCLAYWCKVPPLHYPSIFVVRGPNPGLWAIKESTLPVRATCSSAPSLFIPCSWD